MSERITDSKTAQGTKRTVRNMVLLTLGMFGFGFALVPLYDVFCEWTGLNGKTGGRYEAVPVAVDESRSIKVQFIATNNESMPWEFRPMETEVVVHPGQQQKISFYAHNPTDKDMIGQAVPSLVPFKAAQYFHKMECFCFNRQPLKAGESAELPLLFTVDQDLPKLVNTITLSYTIFDVTETQSSASNNL